MTTVEANQIWHMKRGDQVNTRWQAGIDLTDATELLFLASTECDAPPEIEVIGTLDPDDPTIVEVLITSTMSEDVAYYYVEIQATFPNGEVITLPEEGYCALIVAPDLGPTASS
jgi:hypothetical protein